MTIQQRIEDQRERIESSLVHLIDGDYIFIDLPYYSNIGDTLIWKGTETFLSRLPYKCLGRASFQTFQFPELSEKVLILMMGGGNWGDLYAPHNQLRKKVVTHYPKNRIIILPQTVYYEGARAARNDANVFRRHNNLIICARDKYSYNFLKFWAFSKEILLLPDMAFCINTDELKKMEKSSISRDLLFQRVDKEKTNAIQIASSLVKGKYDTSDWPLYEGNDPKLSTLYDNIHQRAFEEADIFAIQVYMPNRVKEGVELISQYDRIFSNRLHGAILSILLHKKVYIIDNSYGKNHQYFNTWLKNTENISYIATKHKFRPRRKIRFLLFWMISLLDRIKNRRNN